MRLLILGYSSIVERRILPAAAAIPEISEVAIASKSKPAPATGWPKQGRFFEDYSVALDESGCDVVYLSLPNAFHEHWALEALKRGKHILIDKPALMTLDRSEMLLAEAKRRGLLIAEATVFARHPHFHALVDFSVENGPLTQVAAQFIIPPLPISNFRNSESLGGGCLLDMGPYAAGLIRILGGGEPSSLAALAGGRHPDTGVDMGFSVQAKLANGANFSGHFSFEGEYQNRLIVVSRHGSVIVERVFSPPGDSRVEWRRRVRNVETVVTFDPADTFMLFIQATLSAISSGKHDALHSDLLTDARIRAAISSALAA